MAGKSAANNGEATAVAVNPVRATDDQLRGIVSFEDAIRSAAAIHGEVTNVAEVLGSGFELLESENKGRLVGVEILLHGWKFNKGDKSDEFVSCEVITRAGEKYIITDGGAGIYQQLSDYSKATGKFGGLYVPKGLAASEYETCKDCSRPNPLRNDECPHCGTTRTDRGRGVTYYLSTSK